jgi:hypothetical protein
MRKLVIIIVNQMFISCVANSQYKINKTKYNYRTYSYQKSDPYIPAVAGVASFFVPGLGQMFANELGRGACFLGGFVVCGFTLRSLDCPERLCFKADNLFVLFGQVF